MYEATVSVAKENAHLLDYVKKQMEPALSEVDGLVAETEDKFRNLFSLACADTYRFQIRRKLTDVVSQALSLGYKNVYVRQLLNVDGRNFYQNVLVNTICLFDNDFDKQAISRLVDAEHTVCIDGYYNFRLEAVKRKWQEIVKLVSDNFYVLTDNRLITEFLQYLLESAPSKVKNLSVSIESDGFVLYGAADRVVEPTQSIAPYFSPEEEAMLNVLWLKPQKVKIYHFLPLSKPFCAMLEELFDVEYVQVS